MVHVLHRGWHMPASDCSSLPPSEILLIDLALSLLKFPLESWLSDFAGHVIESFQGFGCSNLELHSCPCSTSRFISWRAYLRQVMFLSWHIMIFAHLHHIYAFSLTLTHAFKINCNLFKHNVIHVHNYLEDQVPGGLNVFLINFHKV